MRLKAVLLTLATVALAFDLARALVTHDGVGPFEYAVGVALVALLAAAAARFARHGVRT
jgi:hypothetical protein